MQKIRNLVVKSRRFLSRLSRVEEYLLRSNKRRRLQRVPRIQRLARKENREVFMTLQTSVRQSIRVQSL